MTKPLSQSSARAQRVLADLTALKVADKDLEEEFVASPGPGGQNVNKVATCVILRHGPSGEIVKCHEYRTQLANRIRAREILAQRLQRCQRREVHDRLQRQAKERARRRRRSTASKEKMLEGKRRRSDKKQSRKKISIRDAE